MSSDFIKAFQAGLTTSCVFLAFLLFVACAGMALAPLIREQWAKVRKAKPLEKALAFVVLVAAIAYGGAKPIRNAGADEGIELAFVAAEYDTTNDVTTVDVGFVGRNVTVATPVWVRNDQKEIWRELEKIGATVTVDLPTNVLSFVVSGDVSTNKYWWVGSDTPAVIIESKGIEIMRFAASSRAVEIEWTCDDENAVEFVVQRRPKGSQSWQTVGITQALGYVFVGFTVGETWEWRVMSTYEEGD